MHKGLQVYTGLIAAFFTVFLFTAYTKDKVEVPPAQVVTEYNLPQIVKAVDMDKRFDFAGENLPIDNRDVYERLDRELLVNTYWQSSTLLNLKSANKYFPIIEPILAEYGIPDDFKYLAVAESNLRNARSPAGAKGIWQFMKSTGEHYGLEINSHVDERYHLEKSTVAACKYLQGYYKRFGSWVLAAAAYNMGGTSLSRVLKEQKGQTYFDLSLNSETDRYVFRLVAIKEIMQDPRQFGFYLEEDDYYPPIDNFDLLEVNSSVESLADLAATYDLSYRTLKVYNPWLISGKLPNASRKKYLLKIPHKKF